MSNNNNNNEVIASYTINNGASMNIYEIIDSIDQSVIAGINDEEPKEYIVEIEINEEDENDYRHYFMYGDIRYYLDEFMRV